MNKNDIKLMSESYKKVLNPIKEDLTPGLLPSPVERGDEGKPIILTMKERKLLIEMLENDMGSYETPEEEIGQNDKSFYENLIRKLKGNSSNIQRPSITPGL